MGKGCSKKRMFYCNDINRFLTNSKECWLGTGACTLYNFNALCINTIISLIKYIILFLYFNSIWKLIFDGCGESITYELTNFSKGWLLDILILVVDISYSLQIKTIQIIYKPWCKTKIQ